MTELPGIQRVDQRPVPANRHEIRAMMAVRNEALRLPSVLRHHRAIGVDRFFVIDNASTDGTLEFLAAQPDVHLFSTQGSFAESGYGLAWLNAALDRFGHGYWCLTIDADEMFVYPFYETVKLQTLCQFLDSVGALALFAFVLDMYADKPLAKVRHEPGQPLLDTCRYFDRGPYRLVRAKPFPHRQIYGGVRERIFSDWRTRGYNSPTMSAIPLVKWEEGRRYTLGRHALTPTPMSKLIAGLLHFKFLNDFHERAQTEVARGEHYANAREYRVYAEFLKENPSINLVGKESIRYEGSSQLVAMKLMRTTPEFEKFLAANDARRESEQQPP